MEKTRIAGLIVMIIFLSTFVSAGVGIKWDRESMVVNQAQKNCIDYSVYNPWPEESYAKIEVSDELKAVLVSQESETKLIPSNTASTNAIPIRLCFVVPQVYSQDCWIGNYICKMDCNEPQVMYDGEVLVRSVPPPTDIGGAGGSATTMAVSAPLKIRVSCIPHTRDYTLIYAAIALIAVIIMIIIIYKKYRTPKVERDKEKMKRLQDEIRRESQKKK